jgi:drug/metabolite transporter (DMT)-like permease
MPPLTFLCVRFLLGTVLVAAWFALVRHRLRREGGVLSASATATIFLFFGYVLQTVGLYYTTASNSAFLTALYVIIVPLMLRRFDRRVIAPTTIATVGLWLLVKPSAVVNLGDVMTVGCAVAFAGHIVCLERYTRLFDAPSLLLWQVSAMTLLFLPMTAWEQPPADAFTPSTVLMIGLAVTGIFATGAFAVQMWAQQLIPAQQVALIFASEPAYAAWLSWYFLGETLDLQGWIGSGLILIAVLIGAFASSPPEAAAIVEPA